MSLFQKHEKKNFFIGTQNLIPQEKIRRETDLDIDKKGNLPKIVVCQ